MPPQAKISKDNLLDAAANIIRRDGTAGLNARDLAKEAGCSTQPIFSKFESMEDVENQVRTMIYSRFMDDYMGAGKEENPLISMAVYYVEYAQKNPRFFEMLFLSPSGYSFFKNMSRPEVMEYIADDSSLSEQYTKMLIRNFYFYANGVAVSLAMGEKLDGLQTNDSLTRIFKDTYKAYRKMFRKKAEND